MRVVAGDRGLETRTACSRSRRSRRRAGRDGRSVARSASRAWSPRRSVHLERALDLDGGIERQADTPTVVRAWRPLSPNAVTIRSDAPFITLGPSAKPGAELMKPPSRTTRATLSRSPSAALSCASRLTAQALRRLGAVLDRDAAAELALGDQLALGVEAELAGNDQQLAGAHERHVVGDRRGRGRQFDPEVRKLLFNRAGHAVLPDAASRPKLPNAHENAAFVFADRAGAGKKPRRRPALRHRHGMPILRHRGKTGRFAMKLAVAPAFLAIVASLGGGAAAPGRGAGQRGRARLASRGLRSQACPIARQAADERGQRAHSVRFLGQPLRGLCAAVPSGVAARQRRGQGFAERPARHHLGGGRRASGCASTRRISSTTGCATRSTARPSGSRAASASS